MISRRHLLKATTAAGLLAAGVPLRAAAAKKIPIGLQLYSVRKQCEQDLPAVLAAVAKMGYQGVEFAGYYGRKADELRKLLDANGLVCCGTHTAWGTIQPQALPATVEFNKTIGNKYLIVPSLPKEKFASVAALKEVAQSLNDVAEKVKAEGMVVGYHAHGGDFKPVEGQVPWYVLFDNAGPGVVMQLDIGNCMDGGGDPYATLKKYPGRSKTVHLKEHGGKPGAPVGEGDVKWKDVFEICETTGGTEWYIVEHESDPTNPLKSIEVCLQNLRKMGK